MTTPQLILDTDSAYLELPESIKGGYSVVEVPLIEHVQMISGRTVAELRGLVWGITYQYGYFSEELKNKVLSVARKGLSTPIQCTFLVPSSNETLHSRFFVMAQPTPKFMWSADGKPLWGDFVLSLREVRPHD